MFGRVPCHDSYPQASQTSRRRVICQIRPADPKTEIHQNLGNAAHTRTTDTDKMDVFYFMFHFALISLADFTNSSHTCATSNTASGLAKARAFSAICSNWPRV